MIDLRLFQSRFFSINLITRTLTFVAVSGTIILIPFYLQNVLGYATRDVGLLMAIIPIFLGLVAPLTGALSDRVGTRPVSIFGLIVLVLGSFALSTLNAQTTALGFGLRILPIGLGMGIFQSPNSSAILGAVPRERLGVTTGLLAVSRAVGQTTGIAVMGAFWAATTIYHSGASLPGGATTASISAQANGLQDTFLFSMAILAAALLLSAWQLSRERRDTIIALQTD